MKRKIKHGIKGAFLRIPVHIHFAIHSHSGITTFLENEYRRPKVKNHTLKGKQRYGMKNKQINAIVHCSNPLESERNHVMAENQAQASDEL